jgi:MtN3 and saliva related transmembrane protein
MDTVVSDCRSLHSSSLQGVSLLMHITFTAGFAFWFALGVMVWNWPMMIANALTFALTIVIISMKLYYG